MRQIESFVRGEALGSEQRLLPAAVYNEMILLFHRRAGSCLFVPIRSMQYMAVIDNEEVIFVDSQRRTTIEFSWQKFTPQTRSSLDDPVTYEFVYYNKKALETMKRAQVEFAKFIHQMNEREIDQNKDSDIGESVIPFRGKPNNE